MPVCMRPFSCPGSAWVCYVVVVLPHLRFAVPGRAWDRDYQLWSLTKSLGVTVQSLNRPIGTERYGGRTRVRVSDDIHHCRFARGRSSLQGRADVLRFL